MIMARKTAGAARSKTLSMSSWAIRRNMSFLSGHTGTDEGETEYRIKVASDRETREKAYRLAHDVYRATGLVSPDPTGMVLSPFDAEPETFTLLVEDAGEKPRLRCRWCWTPPADCRATRSTAKNC